MGKWSICKCLYDRILLAWSETWKGKQCTLIFAILHEVNSKFWNHYAVMWAHGGSVKAATQMKKLNPDLAANLLQVVEMSLVAVPPSPSWYPSCSELLCCARGSPSVPLLPLVPHLPKSWCAMPAVMPCLWTGVNGRLQVFSDSFKAPNCKPLCSFILPLFSGEAVFMAALFPQLPGRGGQAAGDGTSKACSEKVHPVQLWGGWQMARGVPVLHGCDITQF